MMPIQHIEIKLEMLDYFYKYVQKMSNTVSFFLSPSPSLPAGSCRAVGDGGRPWSIHFHTPYGNSVVCTEEVCANSDLGHMCFSELQTQQSWVAP